jgi:hypothetical protein
VDAADLPFGVVVDEELKPLVGSQYAVEHLLTMEL